MPNISLWSDVSIDMQSAIGSAVAISNISNANPGVVTHSGTDPSNGDYVLITATGMSEVDGRVFRVANQAVGSFELEGEDTSNYGQFTSGSFQVLTLGVSIGTVTDLSSSGGDFNFIDVTTIHDNVAKQIPGNANAISYSFTNIWDAADAGLLALKAASDAKGQRAMKFTFANGQIMVFNGYIGASLIPGGNAQDKVTTQTTVTMFGTPTYYAS